MCRVLSGCNMVLWMLSGVDSEVVLDASETKDPNLRSSDENPGEVYYMWTCGTLPQDHPDVIYLRVKILTYSLVTLTKVSPLKFPGILDR